jgi:hypothetical protein
MILETAMLPRAAAAALLLAGCVTAGGNAPGPRDALTLTGTDVPKAATLVADFLRQRGYDASLNSESAVLVKGDVNLLLIPVLMESGIDRLMLEAIYSFTSEARAGQLVGPQVLQLNHDYDFAQFSVDDDGDLFILTTVTFVDQLDFIELMHAMNQFKAGTLQAVSSVPAGMLE